MKIDLIAGARPNFMKIAPIYKAMQEWNWTKRPFPLTPRFIYTGQHDNPVMSIDLFSTLGLSPPSFTISCVGSGVQQLTEIMTQYSSWLKEKRPAMVVVVGDVFSTLAAAYVAKLEKLPICHVEAGLRSNNLKMPEELNRRMVDHISDLLLAPSADALYNLTNESVIGQIELVGNVMIDSLVHVMSGVSVSPRKGYDLIVTMHRPENVDDREFLIDLLGELDILSVHGINILFPVHPRTTAKLLEFGLTPRHYMANPVPYSRFIKEIAHAKVVLTDSGGIQEETTFLGVQCLTLRDETERPITVEKGTNKLIGIRDLTREVMWSVKQTRNPKPPEIEGWDGKAGERAVQSIANFLETKGRYFL